MADRDARREGVEHYRKCFSGGSGAYVLADLRNACRAREHEIDPEQMFEEARSDWNAYCGHVATVKLYRYIRGLVDITDDELDRLEENLTAAYERSQPDGRRAD